MKNSIYHLEIEYNKEAIQNEFETIKSMFESENYKEMLSKMYNFIDYFGFWDQMIDYLNYGDKDQEITKRDGIYSAMWRFAKYSKNEEIKRIADDILVNKETIKEQYSNNNDMEITELLANIMNLSDTVIKIMSNNRNSLNRQGIESKEIALKFTEIRETCINRLIELRNQGENLMIGNGGVSRKEKQKLHICIPGYSEPFEAVIIEENNNEPLINGYDSVFFTKQNGNFLTTTFPIKMTNNQTEILKYLANNFDTRELKTVEGRIRWFSVMNGIFRRNKLKNPEIIKKPTIDIDKEEKKYIPASQGRIRRIKRENTSIDENRVFLKDINERMGGFISDEIIESMLNRASYSMKNLYERIRPDLNEAVELIDIPENDRENETLKLFMYIRITKPISKIQAKTLKPEEIKSLIEDSVLEYNDALNLFKSLMEHSKENGQEIDYKTVKSMMTRKGDEAILSWNLPTEDVLDNQPAEQETSTEESIDDESKTETGAGEGKDISKINGEEDELVALFRERVETLMAKKRTLGEEKEELLENTKMLRELEAQQQKLLDDIGENKSNIVNELKEHKNKIEKLEEQKRRIEAEINQEKEAEAGCEEKLKGISKERKETITEQQRIQNQLLENEKRKKEIDSELDDIANKEKNIRELIQ